MSPASKNKPSSARQSIEELQARYQKLDKEKTEAEINLKNAKKDLEKLKAEALEKYQTDDVEKLQEILAAMTEENEQRRRKYQADLDKIETDLTRVEQPSGADAADASTAAGETS